MLVSGNCSRLVLSFGVEKIYDVFELLRAIIRVSANLGIQCVEMDVCVLITISKVI